MVRFQAVAVAWGWTRAWAWAWAWVRARGRVRVRVVKNQRRDARDERGDRDARRGEVVQVAHLSER